MGLVQLLGDADRILVFTGAGISTGSGIRDFRGPKGVGRERRPVYFDDFMNSEVARIEHWDQKCQAWPSFRDAEPNAVHKSVADLERAGKLAMVVTQNIDGLHTRGGTSSGRLVELHGTTTAIECMTCHARTDPAPHVKRFLETRTAPVCDCGGYLKPATISFGQNLDPDTLKRAEAAVRETDLVVALGSTLSVYPAAGVPLAAAERGVPYVVINRGETDHDGHTAVTLRLEGDVVEVLPPAVAEALAP
jgi:NAD-dependent deacetylase